MISNLERSHFQKEVQRFDKCITGLHYPVYFTVLFYLVLTEMWKKFFVAFVEGTILTLAVVIHLQSITIGCIVVCGYEQRMCTVITSVCCTVVPHVCMCVCVYAELRAGIHEI